MLLCYYFMIVKQLYSNIKTDDDIKSSRFGKNLTSTNILMFGDAEYYDAIGANTEAEEKSRYHLGTKEYDALKRKLNLANSGILSEDIR